MSFDIKEFKMGVEEFARTNLFEFTIDDAPFFNLRVYKVKLYNGFVHQFQIYETQKAESLQALQALRKKLAQGEKINYKLTQYTRTGDGYFTRTATIRQLDFDETFNWDADLKNQVMSITVYLEVVESE